MIRILVADDDAIIREGLKMIIESQPDLECVACATNGNEAVEWCRDLKPDVALLDIRMPLLDGILAGEIIIKEELSSVLLLTTFDEQELILRSLRSGVSGYILKNSPSQRILSAIRTVSAGGTVFQKDVLMYITSQVMKEKPTYIDLFNELTDRELEVAALVAKGRSNKEIGANLFISDGTVRNHISTILDKTGLEHRTQIAIAFLSNQ